MNETQRAAAERLADDLQRFDGAERESLRDEAAAILRELLAEPQGEPVVYTTKSQLAAMANQHQRYVNAVDAKFAEAFGIGSDKVPLYTHPPQQRRPLTDAQIDEVTRKHWGEQLGSMMLAHRTFARAIERAITGEPT